jgi:acetyltransferase-like isoleucine patch superfamily enzyme
MRIKKLYWQYKAKAKVVKTLFKLKLGLNASWGKGIIESGVIIDGPLHRLILDENSVIEKGAVINTKYNGKITIGKNSKVLYGAMLLTYYGNIIIGDDCSINPYVILYGHGDLSIGNSVRIATHTVIIPSNHTFDDVTIPIYKQPLNNKGINIHDDVWIGCGAKILDGVTIGTGSVIGAGAVVNKNIEAFTINAGIPSKVIKKRL